MHYTNDRERDKCKYKDADYNPASDAHAQMERGKCVSFHFPQSAVKYLSAVKGKDRHEEVKRAKHEIQPSEC
jgi:hypothetical protein